MLGYAFMGKAHVERLPAAGLLADDAPLTPRLVSIAGRNAAGGRGGGAPASASSAHVTDWRELVADPGSAVRQQRPNDLHGEPTIAAAEAGKHVVCEKPLARDAEESYAIWQRVERAGVSTCAPSTTASCPPCGWPAS